MAGDGYVLRLERTFAAPREVVYRLLSDPVELATWWGPIGFTVPAIDFEPVVGRSYRIAMRPPDGDVFHLSGEFLEVERPRRLVFTFLWDPPHADDRPTTVTIDLEDPASGTTLRLDHGVFATAERHALHEAGWTESLQRLEQLLAR